MRKLNFFINIYRHLLRFTQTKAHTTLLKWTQVLMKQVIWWGRTLTCL